MCCKVGDSLMSHVAKKNKLLSCCGILTDCGALGRLLQQKARNLLIFFIVCPQNCPCTIDSLK